MQAFHTSSITPAGLRGLSRRLYRWLKSRGLLLRHADLARQLATLAEHMAYDERMAALNRRMYLKSPVLVSRMAADRALHADLNFELQTVARQLRELGVTA